VIKGTDRIACKKFKPPLLNLKCVCCYLEITDCDPINTTDDRMEGLE